MVQFSHPSMKERTLPLPLPKLVCLDVLLQLDDNLNRCNIKGFPLAEYTARHRADIGNVGSQIHGGMELRFEPEKPHFAA